MGGGGSTFLSSSMRSNVGVAWFSILRDLREWDESTRAGPEGTEVLFVSFPARVSERRQPSNPTDTGVQGCRMLRCEVVKRRSALARRTHSPRPLTSPAAGSPHTLLQGGGSNSSPKRQHK